MKEEEIERERGFIGKETAKAMPLLDLYSAAASIINTGIRVAPVYCHGSLSDQLIIRREKRRRIRDFSLIL